MTFRNPINDYRVETSHPALWTFLFGPLYFAKHGAWKHFIISLILAAITFGISWLIYPFFAENAIKDSYLSKGWELHSAW